MWYALSYGQPTALEAKSKRDLLIIVDPAGLSTTLKLRSGIYKVGNWVLYRNKQDAIADGWGWAF